MVKEAGNTVEMVAKAGVAAKVKIKALAPIRLNGQQLKSGDIVECSEDEAKEFCDRRFKTPYNWSGNQNGEKKQPTIARAERVS